MSILYYLNLSTFWLEAEGRTKRLTAAGSQLQLPGFGYRTTSYLNEQSPAYAICARNDKAQLRRIFFYAPNSHFLKLACSGRNDGSKYG